MGEYPFTRGHTLVPNDQDKTGSKIGSYSCHHWLLRCSMESTSSLTPTHHDLFSCFTQGHFVWYMKAFSPFIFTSSVHVTSARHSVLSYSHLLAINIGTHAALPHSQLLLMQHQQGIQSCHIHIRGLLRPRLHYATGVQKEFYATPTLSTRRGSLGALRDPGPIYATGVSPACALRVHKQHC